MEGTILKVSRYCTHDGPGIRTTVFLKGCPLHCLWCHNPESQKTQPEIAVDRSKCVACGTCAAVCSVRAQQPGGVFDRSLCTGCGQCVSACPAGALTLHGQRITSEALLPQLLRDKAFFTSSGGGVTISGGEPLMQPDFTQALLEGCRAAGVHAAMETCGFASETVFRCIASQCDLLLFDVKETDPERHLQYTGAPLAPILRNLHIADDMGIPVLLRVPVIPGLNDRDDHFAAVRTLVDSLQHCIGVEVMPYHTIGAYKYAQLDIPYACAGVPEPSDEEKSRWKRLTARA